MDARWRTLRLLGGTLFLATWACSLGPMESTAPRSYFLNPTISQNDPQGDGRHHSAAVLLVTEPEPQAGFDTPRMVYLLRPLEINYYAFNQWADTPARLLHSIMVKHLDKTGLWRAVLQTPGIVSAQYRLDCDQLVLEQQFFSRPSRVRLALRAQLVEASKRAVVATRYFQVFEVAPSDDAYGGVQAANRATGELLAEMAAWAGEVAQGFKP